MGVDDRAPDAAEADEALLQARIANLGQEPSDAARARIMAAVRQAPMTPVNAPRRLGLRMRWRLALLGVGAAGLLATGGAGAMAASASALPRSPAYALRLLSEGLRVALADPHQQSRLHLQFAAAKVRQAREELGRGDVSGAATLLDDCSKDLEAARAEVNALPGSAEAADLAAEQVKVSADAEIERVKVEVIRAAEAVPTPEPKATPEASAAATAAPTAPPRETPEPSAAPSPAPTEPAGPPESTPPPTPEPAPTP
jgi:hypothetical protein